MRFRHPFKCYTPLRPAALQDTCLYKDGTRSQEPTSIVVPGDSKIIIMFSVDSSQRERKTDTLYKPRKPSSAAHSNVHRKVRWSHDFNAQLLRFVSNAPTHKCALHRWSISNTAAFGGGGFSVPRDESWGPRRLHKQGVVPPGWGSSIQHCTARRVHARPM